MKKNQSEYLIKRNNNELESKISSLNTSSRKLETLTRDSEKSSDSLNSFNEKLGFETEKIQSVSEKFMNKIKTIMGAKKYCIFLFYIFL